MSKYTNKDLQVMAITTLQAIGNADPRGQELIAYVAVLTGMTHEQVIQKITDHANGVFE